MVIKASASPRRETVDLAEVLEPLFGKLSPAALAGVSGRLERIEVSGGCRLFRQGDAGDGLYILVSGRLQAVVRDAEGQDSTDSTERIVGEIAWGESVGEMALLTGEPRSATVYAIRDSVLVWLSNSAFEELILEHPVLLVNLSRLVIRRLGRNLRAPESRTRVRNVAVVFHGDVPDRGAVVRRLADSLRPHGPAMVVDHRRVERDADPAGGLSKWIDEQEGKHRFLLWVADRDLTGWTGRCIRHADRVLVIAPFDGAPDPEEIESTLLASENRVGKVSYELVLLHPNGDRPPRGTRRWLECREVERHHHVRLDRDGDFQRVGRFLAGKATGIVFAGGGARGFAHIGVIHALREAGIPLDMAAGASIGALVGAAVATDWDQDVLVAAYRKAFTERNPLNDYNLLPLVSLMRGRKIDRLLRAHFGESGIEDLWLPFFCISSNLTRAVTTVHRRGLLWKALRASISLPGVVPPVVFGHDLHIDGGTSDNFPVAQMRRLGAGKVIASNLPLVRRYELGYEQVPSTWRLVWDRYITRRRRLKVPGLVNTLMRATVLSSLEKGKEAVRQSDLYFETPLKIGLMSWGAFDVAMDAGYRHALATLDDVDLAGEGWNPAPPPRPRPDAIGPWVRRATRIDDGGHPDAAETPDLPGRGPDDERLRLRGEPDAPGCLRPGAA